VALLLPVLVTGATLALVARNRSAGRGPTTISGRELFLSSRNADDTIASFTLTWHAPAEPGWPGRQRLARLGFDTSVDPAGEGAADHYARMLPRQVFVALELNGPALQAVRDTLARDALTGTPVPGREPVDSASRLVVVDVDRDAAALARRYPDPRTHVIAATTMRVTRVERAGEAGPVVTGWVGPLDPPLIQIPGEWAGQLPATSRSAAAAPALEVELFYGVAVEPWVTDVRR
jgi:hypothetical protein